MAMGISVEILPSWKKLQRIRSKIETKTPISVMEAASILMAMAHSVSDVDALQITSSVTVRISQMSHIRKWESPTSLPTGTKKRKRAATKQPAKKKRTVEFTSTPEMPASTRDRIRETGGHGIQLVIQKQLEETDVNRNLGRLSLPAKKLKVDFATAEERRVLSKKENKSKKGMNVAIIDPGLRESSICLKKWKIGSDDVYIFTTQWNSFVQQNGFKAGDRIQLWCFRRDEFEPKTRTVVSSLCFAIVNLHPSPTAN